MEGEKNTNFGTQCIQATESVRQREVVDRNALCRAPVYHQVKIISEGRVQRVPIARIRRGASRR